MRKTKEQRGITLIALIITIVVLLILAVVAIIAVKGEGILDYAKKSASDYEKGKDNEGSVLDQYLSVIDESQSEYPGLIVHEGVIPEGGVYTTSYGTVYTAGNKFPTEAVEEDQYAFGDYVYTHCGFSWKSLDDVKDFYKSMYEKEMGITWEEFLSLEGITEEQVWEEMELTEEFWEEFAKNNNSYWAVQVRDKSKTEYGAILGKINDDFVTDMCYSEEKYDGDGVPYTANYGCFKGCTSLITAPEIPSSVTDMSYAFYGCSSLTTAPDMSNATSVIDMSRAFLGCTSLITAPEIPSSVTSMDSTFRDCTSLTAAPAIPSSVTNMHDAFYKCSSLTTAPDMSNATSVTDMEYTFSGCTSLTTSPIIPSSVTKMLSTFSGCTSLTTVPVIPSSVTSMWYTFSGCTSLTIAPTIPSSVTTIGYTFSGCTSLTTAPTIPSSVTDMEYTFSGCTSLTTSPIIPSGVTNLYGTFNNCTSLTTAPTIPSGVTNLIKTFYNCTSLTGSVLIETNNITNVKDGYYDKEACGGCFYGTEKDITLTGSASDTVKELLASTANNGNVKY